MPDLTFLPREGAHRKALQRQTYFNGAATHLYACLYKDTLSASPATTQAEFLANEADYDGYARLDLLPGGFDTIAALGATAFLLFAHCTATFVYGPAGSPPVGNMIGGLFVLVETAAGPPEVFDLGPVITFDPQIPMGTVGDVVSKLVTEAEQN